MPTSVQVGSDIVQFPDGMSDADMKAALDKEYGGAKNQVTEDVGPPPLKADEGLGLAVGAKRPFDNLAVWLDKIPGYHQYNQVTQKLFGVSPPAADAANTAKMVSDAAAQGRKPGAIGEIAGGTAAMLPITLATRNPLLGGAAAGVLSTKSPNDPAAVARDAAAGGAMGYGADVGLRGLGSIIAPQLNPLVRRLLAQGVELTPGQMLGGMAHRMEDSARSILGIGDMVVGAQARGQRSLNTAWVQHALDPLGVRIPENIPVGHAQIRYAGDALSGAYDTVLGDIDSMASRTGSTLPVAGGYVRPNGLILDPQFGQEVNTLRQTAQGLPADQQHVFENFIQTELRHPFNPQNGSISGRGMKDLDSLIGQRAANFRSSPNPHDRDLGRAFQELQANLRDMVGRQFPEHANTIDAINQGWAHLVRAETAAAPATGGVATPAAIRASTRSTDRSMRHRASARGEALGQQFADAADQVMHPTVGDSGTATRALLGAAAAAAMFGKSSMHNIQVNPWIAALFGAGAVPYATRGTGAAVRAAIASRPAGAAAVRRAVESTRPTVSIATGQIPAENN